MNQMLNFEDKRMAFLGDSITDGHTLILLMEQSLQVAGVTPSICTNVAVCGNRASDMLRRLERDVLAFAPDYCTLSVGVNDANHEMPVSDYQQQVTQLLNQLDQAGIQAILLTPTPNTSSKAVTSTPLVNAYVDFLNQIAAKRQLRIAPVNDAFTKAIEQQSQVLTKDGIHVDFAGYRIMARCVLDAMGYAHVPVVEQLNLQPMPGLIEHWHIRAVSDLAEMTSQTVTQLKPDQIWHELKLPMTEPIPKDWWLDQERQRGFAVQLDCYINSSNYNLALTTFTEPTDRQVYLNTGAGLQTIWLNGKQIYTAPGDSGWHAGRERIAATFKAGINQLVITCGTSFFLSVSETNRW